MNCPLCGTALPDQATTCTRCDWVATPNIPEEKTHTHSRDLAAAIMSVVPGLGHVYKGHLLMGGFILLVVAPLVLALAAYLALPTLGLSFTVPAILLAISAAHAYHIKDRRAAAIALARGLDSRGDIPASEEPQPVPEQAAH